MNRQRAYANSGSVEVGALYVLAVILAGALTGVTIGVGSYTFFYAKGTSYMYDDPMTCANCHVMQDHYDAWSRGSHQHVATCNDCHAGHDPVKKYLVKAVNGFNHSVAMTTGNYHYPFQITDFNRQVTEQSCRHCHESIVQQIDAIPDHRGPGRMECIRCHSNVGHM